MLTCTACGTDYYHNPDVRLLYTSACDHAVCEPCVKRLFSHGRMTPCPGCGQMVRQEDFSGQQLEARQVDSETQVRRKICDIYCKAEVDFRDPREYNDYLEQREELIYRIVWPSSAADARDAWRVVDQYSLANADQIARAQSMRSRQKLDKIRNIIEQEGVFSSHVNADWTDQLPAMGDDGELAAPAPPQYQHPFQARYKDLLASAAAPPRPLGLHGAGGGAGDMSPPLMASGDHGPVGSMDKARQMSGGGQLPDMWKRKARHFFFEELRAGAHVLEVAAAA